MRNVKRSWIVMILAGALVASAGVASAANYITDDGDTTLNFGYDEANHVFIADVSATDEPFICELENGTLVLGYGEVGEDGTVPVLTLDDESGAVEFAFRPAEEVGEGYLSADAPALYTGPEGECGLFGTVFDGVVDHGAFMTAFNEYLDGLDIQGRGCLVRVLAQSGLGKGDQQISEDDVDPNFTVGETGQVDFTTVFASCEHGKPEFDEDHPGRSANHPTPGDHPGQGGDHPTPEDHPGKGPGHGG